MIKLIYALGIAIASIFVVHSKTIHQSTKHQTEIVNQEQKHPKITASDSLKFQRELK